MEISMPLESGSEPETTSWLGRLWQNFLMLGEAIELSEAERLQRRIAALEAAAAQMSERSN
ncbi:MAG: hypothetical protein ACKOQM_00475 [Novosphingobium sp.]